MMKRRHYEGLMDNILKYMHKHARAVTAGELSLYFNLSLATIHAELGDLKDTGRVVDIMVDETEKWLLTERPSVRLGGDSLDGPPPRI
jgi:predicted HTH transcriptional regulator